MNCGAFLMARFLQSIEVERSKLIPGSHTSCRANARKGKAAKANLETEGGGCQQLLWEEGEQDEGGSEL